MLITEIEVGSPLYNKALDLRYELFFKDFDLPKSVTADDLEAKSTHLALAEGRKLLAYGRLSPLSENTYRISQIVVNPKQRRKGHATAIESAIAILIARDASLSVAIVFCDTSMIRNIMPASTPTFAKTSIHALTDFIPLIPV